MIKKVITNTRGLIWLDIVNPTKDELDEVAKEYGLHSTSLEDCLDQRHQPKFEKLGNVNFMIIRSYDINCDHKTDSVLRLTHKIAIFIADGFIITVHRCDTDFIDQLIEKWENKVRIKNADQILILLDIFKSVIFSFSPALDELELSIESFEKKIFSDNGTPEIIREIHWFRSRVSAIRRVFRQSYDVLLKLDEYAENIAPLYQDIRERLERYISITEALREASNDILNTHISLASHKTNEVIRVLTIFSVFFLPLTFIVGVYGMNFEFMPELKWYYGYPMTWLIMIIVTIGIYSWFKRQGWLK